MQTIFVATDRNGKVYTYTDKPVWQDSSGTFAGHWVFLDCAPSFAPPPGECRECRLAPAGEADAKDARISEMEQQLSERDNQLTLARGYCEVYRRQLAEQRDLGSKCYAVAEGLRSQVEQLEKQLATRSPGVMPQFVKQIIGELRESVANLSLSPGRLDSLCGELEACFAPPDGHEWRPVDDANPITAADVGRRVCRLNETVSVFGASSGWSTTSEVYILRPIAPPFVFDGTDGEYKTDSGEIADVLAVKGGKLIALIGERVVRVGADGTFAGGRITGRVG